MITYPEYIFELLQKYALKDIQIIGVVCIFNI